MEVDGASAAAAGGGKRRLSGDDAEPPLSKSPKIDEGLPAPPPPGPADYGSDAAGPSASAAVPAPVGTEGSGEEAEMDDDMDEGDEVPAVSAVVPIAAAAASRRPTAESVKEAKDMVADRLKAKQTQLVEKNRASVKDNIKLHESGWKDRYYYDPFKKADVERGGGLKNMCFNYVKGLCWVYRYYYDGCPSWNWFYPFHYAPFASDLVNIDSFEIDFELSTPFHPFEQLLAVLPAESAHCLPEACSWLMTDPESPLLDIYNSDIPIDPNGKPLPWLWVLLIPFIDESRVRAAMASCIDNLTPEEKHRNSWGNPVMFLSKDKSVASFVLSRMDYQAAARGGGALVSFVSELSRGGGVLAAVGPDASSDDTDSAGQRMLECTDEGSSGREAAAAAGEVFFPCTEGDGICGTLAQPTAEWFAPLDSVIRAPSRPVGAFRNIEFNKVLCLTYLCPAATAHLSRLLDGVKLDDPVLFGHDLVPRQPQKMMRGRLSIVDVAQRSRNVPDYQGYHQAPYAAHMQPFASGSNGYGNQQYPRGSARGIQSGGADYGSSGRGHHSGSAAYDSYGRYSDQIGGRGDYNGNYSRDFSRDDYRRPPDRPQADGYRSQYPPGPHPAGAAARPFGGGAYQGYPPGRGSDSGRFQSGGYHGQGHPPSDRYYGGDSRSYRDSGSSGVPYSRDYDRSRSEYGAGGDGGRGPFAAHDPYSRARADRPGPSEYGGAGYGRTPAVDSYRASPGYGPPPVAASRQPYSLNPAVPAFVPQLQAQYSAAPQSQPPARFVHSVSGPPPNRGPPSSATDGASRYADGNSDSSRGAPTQTRAPAPPASRDPRLRR
jgi:5'-3' exoribonuclease 2